MLIVTEVLHLDDVKCHRIHTWTTKSVTIGAQFSVNLDLVWSYPNKTANWWIHMVKQAGLNCDISFSTTFMFTFTIPTDAGKSPQSQL